MDKITTLAEHAAELMESQQAMPDVGALDQLRALVREAGQASIPPGMTPEKLEKIAQYVELLDRMDIDLEGRKVTFGPARTDKTEMQDDLRAWAKWLRRKED